MKFLMLRLFSVIIWVDGYSRSTSADQLLKQINNKQTNKQTNKQMNEGDSFYKKLWCCVGGEVVYKNFGFIKAIC